MRAMATPRKYSDDSTALASLEGDTEEVVHFLLALKNRSVTPEPEPSCEPSDYNFCPWMTAEGSIVRPKKKSREQPSPVPILPLGFLDAYGKEEDKEPPLLEEHPEIGVDTLLEGSPLITRQDRGLVPDALFIALAQMKPARLTPADRVGCYKDREIGFVGMACKHCGGQPGFGKFFPGTVRSLAQTTTSQTMIKHVGTKCRFTPPLVRQAVSELQRLQAVNEAVGKDERPRYGARKVFFERVWSRLHDQEWEFSETEEETSSEEEEQEPVKQQQRRLPTKKNIKRRMKERNGGSNKRTRVDLAN